jgi:hypothetical protein
LRRKFDAEEAKRILQEAEVDGVKLIDSGFAYHIVDAEISKGKALEFVASKLGIDVRNFAAIGDSENDLDLLKTAGLGIAVGNADLRLKREADIVVPGENGEGVVQALELLGLI